MGNQIEAMKKMIKEFLSSAGDDDLIRMHVWTFTESCSKCFVCKSPTGATNTDLISYTNNIQLSTPPSAPNVKDAYGGDYEENSAAAVSSLLDSFTAKDNIMAFIITDAPPHHKSAGRTGEAQAELRWFATQDPTLPTDIFQRLDHVIQTLNVTFVPINYESHGSISPFYLQAALLTEGICLLPKTNNAESLAKGLVTLMRSMQSTIVNGTVNRQGLAPAITALADSFNIAQADPDTWELFESDPSSSTALRRDYKTSKDKAAIEAGLFGLMETTMDRFSGKKAGKRIRSVDPDVVAAAVRVFVLVMLIRTGFANDEHRRTLDEAQAQLVKLLEKNVETGKRETFYLNRLLSGVLTQEGTVKPSEATSSHCIITLQSAWDTISELEQVPTSAEDVEAWMEIVLQLTMCRLLNIRFPTDAAGNADFMDAWSASVANVSYGAPLSAYASVKLRNESEDGETYRDPSTREEFNSALILAHPDDSVLSACYTTLSALPSLQGLVQSYLVSGGLNIFPSITVGLQGATLLSNLRVIVQDNKPDLVVTPVAYDWLRSVVWSLEISDVLPANDVIKVLSNEGTLNPEDNPSKLMTAFIRYMRKAEDNKEEMKKKWVYLYEELVTNSVNFAQRMLDNGKECDLIPKNEEVVKCYVQDPVDFDPVKALHPAETFDAAAAVKDVEAAEKLKALVVNSPIYKHNRNMLRLFWDLVHHRDLTTARDANDFPLTDSDLILCTMESILLKKRTARYTLITGETKAWVRSSDVSLEAPLANLVKSIYDSRIGSWKSARAKHARSTILGALTKKTQSLDKPLAEDDWVKMLKATHLELLGTKYKLSRMDAPEMLGLVPDVHLITLGPAIVRGTWTTGPPSQLRRHITSILPLFSSHPTLYTELQQALSAQAICSREEANRHGHTMHNTYPGFTGWNQKYHDTRLATKKNHVERKLNCMKDYKLFLDSYTPKLEAIDSPLFKELASMIIWMPNNVESGRTCKDAAELLLEKAKELDEEKVAEFKGTVQAKGLKKVGGLWEKCAKPYGKSGKKDEKKGGKKGGKKVVKK